MLLIGKGQKNEITGDEKLLFVLYYSRCVSCTKIKILHDRIQFLNKNIFIVHSTLLFFVQVLYLEIVTSYWSIL